MDYREAIEKAKNGEEQGFSFLYEKTYKSKYYLALQYMKNKEAAEDVLQEAYMKAFSKLDKLSEPEAFEGWLGTIVANTAKNALAKKNPLLFTDVAVDNEGEEFTYDVEDENPENQPEMAYTREETRELVHSLMDSLSEEQRMCILMFHIEGASISEIAEAMDCSENTVKSRLNYGRKNLKRTAEKRLQALQCGSGCTSCIPASFRQRDYGSRKILYCRRKIHRGENSPSDFRAAESRKDRRGFSRDNRKCRRNFRKLRGGICESSRKDGGQSCKDRIPSYSSR